MRAALTMDADPAAPTAAADHPAADTGLPRRVRRRARRTAGAMPSLAARLADRVLVGDATAAGSAAPEPARAVSELSVGFERRGDVVVARLAGNLDTYTVRALHRRLATVIGTRTPLVLDLSRVELLDSSGLGALITLCNRAVKVGQRVALVSGDGQLLDVLRIAGLHDAFLHARNVGSACSLLARTSLPAIR